MLKPDINGRYQIAFLLLPDYPMASLQAAIAPLLVANEMLGYEVYQWELLGLDKKAVVASNGFSLPTREYQYCQPENLFICTGKTPWFYSNPNLRWWLRSLYKYNTVFGAIEMGSYLLAETRILKQGKICLNSDASKEFLRRFPELEASQEAFLTNKGVISCNSGFSSGSLMLELISQHFNQKLSSAVAAELMLPSKAQSKAEMELHHFHERRLHKAISLMEGNIEHPLSPGEVADKVHISLRHLERLFQRHLQITPGQYYLQLRLEHARHLVHRSNLDIAGIAVRCGFNSPPHFSRSYSRLFGIPPKRDRVERNSHQKLSNYC